MTLFSKRSKYALTSLVYIQLQNLKGIRPGIDEIARETESPRHFTAKILNELVKYGFVMSVKGKRGGFYFDQNRKELTLLEVLIITERDHSINECSFGLRNCQEHRECMMQEDCKPLQDAIEKLFSCETIQTLAKKLLEI